MSNNAQKKLNMEAFALQKKIKENAEELATYLKDLNSWTRDISYTDTELKKVKAARKLPPVRNGEEKEGKKETSVEQQFLKHKETGNEFFKKGDYTNAFEEYSKSLTYKEDSIIYANRAAALLKLRRYLEAELDATKAIALDSGNAKAIYRRGIARKELQNYEGSVKDLERAISLQPNKDAEKELTIVRQLYEGSKVENKSPTQVTTTPVARKRMIVKDVEEVKTEEFVEEFSTPAATKLEQQKKQNVAATDFLNRTNSNILDQNIKQTKGEEKVELVAPTPSTLLEGSKSKVEPITESKPKPKSDNQTPIIVPDVKIEVPKEPPKTSYEFEKYFKELRNEDFYQYLRIIPVSSYKTLFKASFTSEIFSAIIECVHSYFVKNHDEQMAFEILKNLTLIERFDMIVMFMEEKEKKIVDSIFKHLETTLEVSEVRKVRTKYE